jgi:hypothetical protein
MKDNNSKITKITAANTNTNFLSVCSNKHFNPCSCTERGQDLLHRGIPLCFSVEIHKATIEYGHIPFFRFSKKLQHRLTDEFAPYNSGFERFLLAVTHFRVNVWQRFFYKSICAIRLEI